MAICRKCLNALKSREIWLRSTERRFEKQGSRLRGLGGNVGDRALAFDQVADAASIVGLVAEHDGGGSEPIEQGECGGSIVRLSRAFIEWQREPLPIDERVDLGGETAPGATETMISTPFLPLQPAGAPVSKCCR